MSLKEFIKGLYMITGTFLLVISVISELITYLSIDEEITSLTDLVFANMAMFVLNSVLFLIGLIFITISSMINVHKKPRD